MRQELLRIHDSRRYPRANHEAVLFLRLAGIPARLALLAIVLLIGPMELQQLKILFSEVGRVGQELRANRASKVPAGLLDQLDGAELRFVVRLAGC